MVTSEDMQIYRQYDKDIAMFMGEEMMPTVGAVETALREVLSPDCRDRYKAAHDREIKQMRERRFVREGDELSKSPYYKPAEALTAQDKQKALRCRMCYTIKRPELEADQDKPGKEKARLVAKDFVSRNRQPTELTYAPTPSLDGFRAMVASTDVEAGE